MTTVAKLPPDTPPPAVVQSSAAILSVIDKLATNPDIDMEKLERFFALYERQQALEAKRTYDQAFAEMQPELPAINKMGKAEIRKEGKAVGSYMHAKWEHIHSQIMPVLGRHGFALRFSQEDTPKGTIVRAHLAHKSGHEEVAAVPLPFDTSGAKNSIQAVGSSLSYGKRYAAGLVLNFATKDEDDDGAGGAVYIDGDQAESLAKLISSTGTNIEKFCAAFKVESVSDLLAKDYKRAVAMLSTKAVQNKEAAQ